jgi:hypothetical protein
VTVPGRTLSQPGQVGVLADEFRRAGIDTGMTPHRAATRLGFVRDGGGQWYNRPGQRVSRRNLARAWAQAKADVQGLDIR